MTRDPTGRVPPSATVVELDASETHALRRSVLRDHLANRDVDYATDHQPGSFHLGVRDPAGAVIAVATLNLEPAPGHPLRRAARLRGMAVEPRHQGAGLGALILGEALDRLQRDEVDLCWANARTSALGFYRRFGFQAVGEVFDSVGLPHRVVIRDLRTPTPRSSAVSAGVGTVLLGAALAVLRHRRLQRGRRRRPARLPAFTEGALLAVGCGHPARPEDEPSCEPA